MTSRTAERDPESRERDPESRRPDVYSGFFNPLRHISLWYVWTLVWAGFRRPLDYPDLWAMHPSDGPEEQGKKFWHILSGTESHDRKFYIRTNRKTWYALYLLNRTYFWISLFLFLIYSGLRFAGPFLLSKIVTFIENRQNLLIDERPPLSEGYTLAFYMFLSQFSATLCTVTADSLSVRMGLRSRNALIYSSFEHVLFSEEGMKRTSQGQVINLVSTDTNVVLEFARMSSRFWTAPIVLIAGTAYIYVLIGPSSLVGVGVMVLFAPVFMWLSKIQSLKQRAKMAKTDARVKLINMAIQGIQVVKLYAYEAAMDAAIAEARREELKSLQELKNYQAATLPVAIVIPNLASVLTFVTYVLMGNSLTPATAFSVVSLFVVIRAPFIQMPIGIMLITRLLVMASRFDKFFHVYGPAVVDDDDGVVASPVSSPSDAGAGPVASPSDAAAGASPNDAVAGASKSLVSTKSSSFRWQDGSTVALDKINVDVVPGEFLAIVGKVGSGKSALLAAMLGELESDDSAFKSLLDSDKTVAYCAQDAFIQNDTLRNNVLFGTEYDEERYERAVHACALGPDIAALPGGDSTEIGERGVNVSGGQKARISLARAVYRNADVVVLDDILSAVDAHVSSHIVRNVLSSQTGLCKSSTRILVTNQLQVLQSTDRVVVMDFGKVAESGTYSELSEREGSKLKEALEDEAARSGRAAAAAEAAAGGGPSVDEEGRPALKAQHSVPELADKKPQKRMGGTKLTTVEAKNTGAMSTKVYTEYWLAGSYGRWYFALFILGMFFVCEASFLSIDSYLSTAADQPENSFDVNRFVAVYVGLTLVYIIVVLFRSFLFAYFSVRAAKTLHDRLVSRITRFPMTFFWQTPMGRVLNRVSTDVNNIDVILPQSWQWMLMTLARTLGILVLIAVTAPFFAVAIPPLFVVYMSIRELYRRSARELQRLESVSRSPVYNWLGETMAGKSTIRAYGRVDEFLKVASSRTRTTHEARFAMDVTMLWVAQHLEFVGAAVVFLAGVALVARADYTAPGLAGLALAYSLNIVVNLQMVVRQLAQVEALSNCVERVLEYTALPVEGENNDGETRIHQQPPPNWPSKGEIEFENVSLRYRHDTPLALKNVSLKISPELKIGICGRTGAGKSSFLSLLFRLVDPITAGTVKIDNVDISTLNVSILRSRLAIIPQTPVLFSGTVRFNVDPFNDYSDAEIWDALEKVELKSLVTSLDDQVSEGGSNYSVGERQLMCIARAMVKKAKVVLADEITAAVDSQTDEKLQRAIRLNFKHATVLTIAHRLNTIADSDKILVLDDGEMVEWDSPETLLKDPNSQYSRLVAESQQQ